MEENKPFWGINDDLPTVTVLSSRLPYEVITLSQFYTL